MLSHWARSTRGILEFVVGPDWRSHCGFGTIEPNSEIRNNDTYGVIKITQKPTATTGDSAPRGAAHGLAQSTRPDWYVNTTSWGAIARAQLDRRPADVGTRGRRAEHQPGGDLVVAEPFAHQGQDLPAPGRSGGDAAGSPGSGSWRTRARRSLRSTSC
jgi:hypothetical protein